MNQTKQTSGVSKFTLSILALLFSVFFQALSAQEIKLDEKAVTANLKKHISTLASDKFKGRETGTKGEQLAADYIVSVFQSIGIPAKGDRGLYEQEFTFTAGVKYGKKNHLSINEKSYKIDVDYYPLAYSSNSAATGEMVYVGYGISAPKLEYNDYKNLTNLNGKVFLIEFSSPDGMNLHSKYADYSDIRQKIDTAIAKGASAIIFINPDTTVDNPSKHNFKIKTSPVTIPVVFCTKDQREILVKNPKLKVSVEAELIKIEGTGRNIIGFIDNGSKTTVVLGAHYDHLGMGEDGSLYRGKPAIHNGADDNASGTAALLEIARYLKTNIPASPAKEVSPSALQVEQAPGSGQNNNYLFIAFSGEEKGLYGSNHFMKHPTIPANTINYMINFDMVGRLNADKQLAINGVGTSPEWMAALNTIHIDSVKYKTTESGIGPSDQTSFYMKDIPAMHFFTGSHSDYHKPSDDEDKINYAGEVTVMKIALTLISDLNTKGKIAFTKTKEEKNEDTPRFKVTLGVVPDYLYEGEGLRIDGISEGKAADKAGLKTGDIVLQLGEIKVADMMSYMKALGKFSKGDEAIVKVMREKEMKEFKVKFQ